MNYELLLTYLKSIKFLIKISLEVKDTSTTAKSYNGLANHYIDLGKVDSAYIYLVKAEKLFYQKNCETCI